MVWCEMVLVDCLLDWTALVWWRMDLDSWCDGVVQTLAKDPWVQIGTTGPKLRAETVGGTMY